MPTEVETFNLTIKRASSDSWRIAPWCGGPRYGGHRMRPAPRLKFWKKFWIHLTMLVLSLKLISNGPFKSCSGEFRLLFCVDRILVKAWVVIVSNSFCIRSSRLVFFLKAQHNIFFDFIKILIFTSGGIGASSDSVSSSSSESSSCWAASYSESASCILTGSAVLASFSISSS